MKLTIDEVKLLDEGLSGIIDKQTSFEMGGAKDNAIRLLRLRLQHVERCIVVSQKNTPKQLAARVRD